MRWPRLREPLRAVWSGSDKTHRLWSQSQLAWTAGVGRTSTPLPAAVEFGRRVRGLRLDRGWSIERLADESGMHWTYVGSVERGERNISLNNICRLAKALDVGADGLVVGLERQA